MMTTATTTKGLPRALLALGVLAAACMAERRPPVAADTATAAGARNAQPDSASATGDAAVDGAADTGPGSGDGAGSGADGAGDAAGAGEPETVASGCVSDGQCAALVASPCHAASCNLATGLCVAVALADGATCLGARDKCTASGTCKAGACQKTSVSCDDGKLCTADSCVPATGCVNAAVSGPCTDGNACTVGDKCLDGACVATLPTDCTAVLDGNGGAAHDACTLHACDPKLGCLHVAAPADVACTDGDGCTVGDHCEKQACKGTPQQCPDADNNPCTLSGCNPTTSKCDQLPVLPELYVACNDGSACTVQDACAGATCKGKDNCDDKNPCTEDACLLAQACTHTSNDGASCAATDACAVLPTCQNGACKAAAKDCDDGNLCSADACDPAQGCTYTAVTAACSDGNPCTEPDACAGLTCKAGAAVVCDDGKACTADSCVAGKGCAAALSPFGASCPGPAPSACVAGLCVAKDTCDDGLCSLEETVDTCAKDCPADGGACKPDVPACVVGCTASKCAPLAAACALDAGCKTLDECVTACQTTGCEHACLGAAQPTSQMGYTLLNQCRSAFCVANAWIGKKCKGGGVQYVVCVDACENAACKVLATACKATAGCSAVRDCMKACAVGDAPCVTGCQAKGSTADAQLNGDLDQCSQTYCQ
ncbi:MAG: hypothetical protein EXR79_05265 [Myxococcales bacterium]|nr:hypothetical protein [Myxococcales bacterium]